MMRVRADDVILDTGVLAALLDAADPDHEAATSWLAQRELRFHTVESVLTEASHFLPAHMRPAVAEFAVNGPIRVHALDTAGYRRVAAILRKYADLRPDWADASLVWVAEQLGIHRIATFDVRDFSTYRIHGRSKFQIEPIA